MANDSQRRFVLDTNTLVSAFLFPESVPGKVLECALDQHRLLMSLDASQELAGVLRREKFDRYLSGKRREELLAGTIRNSEFVAVSTRIAVCRDASDNKFLELAVDGGAAAIVTGDPDLLVLNPFRGLQVLTPRQFLTSFATV